MDALMASYASDSDSDGGEPAAVSGGAPEVPEPSALLPPPPLDLLQPPNFVGMIPCAPISLNLISDDVLSADVVIPSDARKQLTLSMKRAASLVPDLYAVDADYALSELCKDEQKLEKVLLSREFHVSLGRPVAVQVHQIDSFVAMLRQKFQPQQRYCMEFNKWEHFVNDDCTRSFLSLEVTRTGLPEIRKQILMVDEVYRLHGLPEFYTNPRPHISLVWALGDVSGKLKQAIKDIEKYQSSMSSLQKCNVRCKFSRVVCKVVVDPYAVPQVSSSSLKKAIGFKTERPRASEVIPGWFLAPEDLYWHDPTGGSEITENFVATKNRNMFPRRMLSAAYPNLCELFTLTCGVPKAPTTSNYVEMLLRLSTTVLLSQAANHVFCVFVRWTKYLQSESDKTNDILYLKNLFRN
ncbi:unnamed protein product [Miscanthus lutarioriparius]|uniref:U6 snRNA phosphodiesterase 1 n=1 Tax=Miscanthus lutarioriparius TaxID=422564 RepID=A0A811PLA1_9POAL|nr:unnamed protein product [Miscanthus lutarioriparius]